MSSQMAAFLDQAGGLWMRGALNGKIGGAFASTATQHGGQETTLFSIITVVSVTDETDRVVAEKRLSNDLSKILAFLAPWHAELAGVVVESTFYARPEIMHGLARAPVAIVPILGTPGNFSPPIDFA
jgi:hypothetical protein